MSHDEPEPEAAAPRDNDRIFDELVAAATATAGDGADAAGGDDAVEEVRQRAIDVVDEIRGDETMREGMKDLRSLSFAIGSPMFFAFFEALVDAADATPARKRQWRRTAKDADPGRGNVGSMKIDLPAAGGLPATAAYAVLRACQADHNFGAQLEKVDRRLSRQHQLTLRESLSGLRALGLRAFADLCATLTRTLTAVLKKVPGAPTFEAFCETRDDRANTTMYTGVPAAGRVGIFIDLEAEIPENVDE